MKTNTFLNHILEDTFHSCLCWSWSSSSVGWCSLVLKYLLVFNEICNYLCWKRLASWKKMTCYNFCGGSEVITCPSLEGKKRHFILTFFSSHHRWKPWLYDVSIKKQQLSLTSTRLLFLFLRTTFFSFLDIQSFIMHSSSQW